MDFRNDPAAQGSKGLRNNNPGNLRPGDSWKGMAGTSGNFVVFTDVTYGIRAAALNLYTQYYVHGLKTLSALIKKYAPASDNNDPAAYANTVSKETGIGVNEDMALNTARVKAIIRAMMNVELTKKYSSMVTDADMEKGISMAGKFDIAVIQLEGIILRNKKPLIIAGSIAVALSVYLYFITKNKK